MWCDSDCVLSTLQLNPSQLRNQSGTIHTTSDRHLNCYANDLFQHCGLGAKATVIEIQGGKFRKHRLWSNRHRLKDPAPRHLVGADLTIVGSIRLLPSKSNVDVCKAAPPGGGAAFTLRKKHIKITWTPAGPPRENTGVPRGVFILGRPILLGVVVLSGPMTFLGCALFVLICVMGPPGPPVRGLRSKLSGISERPT